MQPAEEDLLVLAAQQGNQKAFRVIHNHYQKALLRYAYKVCGDTDLAQDAVQEAWLKVAGNLRRLRDPRMLRGFLYQMVHWRAIDMLRRHKRHRDHEAPLEEDRVAGPEQQAGDARDALRVAMNRLPPLERHMLHLFYLEDLRVAEIAVVLEIPPGTVKSRLNRARKLLKQRFEIE